LLGLLAAARETRNEILANFPYLEAGDISESLGYAAAMAEDETLQPVR
jgi:uncharacterized protein (DUF433 family)